MNAARFRLFRVALLTVTLAMTPLAAQDRSARTLDIYVIDVEGGSATLFVSPTRESLLIDTGNGGQAATRDADRMMAAIKVKVLFTAPRLQDVWQLHFSELSGGFAKTHAAP